MAKINTMQHWVDLFPGATVDVSLQAYRDVVAYYGEPSRYYHTLVHIAHMLEAQQQYFPDAPRSVLVAVWLHDVIYNSSPGQDELDSGTYAEKLVLELGESQAFATEVKDLILVTAGHMPGDAAGQMLCDLDLLSLGCKSDVYKANTAKIRREYSHISGFRWRMGRKAFIESFLDRPSVYHDPVIKIEFEAQARRNLCAELTALFE